MHTNSILLFEKYAQTLFKPQMKILEVGPDQHPSTFRNRVSIDPMIWETLDIFYSKDLTYVAQDEYNFPIEDNTYDIVISAQVIEHVKKIWLWTEELCRVCKPGGYVVTINPVSWPYHEAPVDCWRIYPEGMKTLYENAGLIVQLSLLETLEIDTSKYLVPNDCWVPGISSKARQRSIVKRLTGWPVLVPGTTYRPSAKNFIKRLIGWPITCSFDTITIGIKDK